MHAITDPIDAVRAEAVKWLSQLETTLTAHGFTAEVEVKFWALTATTRSDTLAPARSQRVKVATDTAGALNWYLVTPREDPEQVQCELLCPAAAIAEATELIARALRTAGQR